jgi:hypothetical protein
MSRGALISRLKHKAAGPKQHIASFGMLVAEEISFLAFLDSQKERVFLFISPN